MERRAESHVRHRSVALAYGSEDRERSVNYAVLTERVAQDGVVIYRGEKVDIEKTTTEE
jgi:hypothetical protein